MVWLLMLLFDAAVFLMLVLSSYFQEYVLNFIILQVKNASGKYVLSHRYIRYLGIILGQIYKFLFCYIPIFGITKIFDFTDCVCTDFIQMNAVTFSL